MKRQLFVPVLVLAVVIIGCKTELLDTAGNPVLDASGNPMMLPESAHKRLKRVTPNTQREIYSAISSAANKGAWAEVANFKLPDNRIKFLIGPTATQEEFDALKILAGIMANKYRTEVVYPAHLETDKNELADSVALLLSGNDESKFAKASDLIVNVKKTGIPEIDAPLAKYAADLNKRQIAPALAMDIVGRKVKPRIKEFLAKGQFDQARETLLRATTTDNAEANALVRLFTVETLLAEVNPAEWAYIEAELNNKTAEFVKAKKFDEAIAWLKGYRRVRTHSIKLDGKQKAIEAELVKIGVEDENMKPILDATGTLVGKVEKILNTLDDTTNTVSAADGKTATGGAPDLDAYKSELEAYRQALLRCNCTEDEANGIVDKFRKDVDPLLEAISKAAAKGAGKTGEKAPMGTGTINSRIDKMTARLLKDVKAKKAAHLVAFRKANVKTMTEKMVAEMKKCVAEGKFEKAREAFWKATSTKDVDMNNLLRKPGVELMLTLVNPKHWAAIEKEFADKTSEARKNAKYGDAIAWAEAYPAVRTYTGDADAKLDDMKDALAEMGVAGDKIQPVIDETQKAEAEAARIAGNVDKMYKTKDGNKGLPLGEYDKLIASYRAALVRKGCPEKVTNELVAKFKAKVSPYVNAIAGGAKNASPMLGSGAVNSRLAKLRAKTINELKPMKCRHVFAEVVAKTTEAVAKGKYKEARNVVRNVAPVKDAEWDAKIYATRIGLLNGVVNPNQCAALLKEIDAKAKEMFDAEKYDEFAEYAKNYEYVHDTYKQVEASLSQLKAAMAGMKTADKTAAGSIDALSAKVRGIMARRTDKNSANAGAYRTELEKALSELEKAIAAKYYDPKAVAAICRKDALPIVAKAPAPMTTWELNEALRARLARHCKEIEKQIAARDAAKAAAAYAQQLADLDAEVSFDSQVTMAENAITRQLGASGPEADQNVNALLGEYARTMRLLKLEKKITPDQATTMLLGGTYLDQPAVVSKALELGAKVNGVSDRDPLRRTALLLAIQTGHTSLLKQLAAANAEFTVADAEGDTALHYAVRSGNLSVIKAMLAKNDVNKTNKAGETALFIAVRRNQKPLVSALIKANADVKLSNANSLTAMDAACIAGSRDVLDVLADAKAEFGPAQLALAAGYDRLAVAQWLVGKGVDVNAPGVMGATRCGTSTQRYLAQEGGIPRICNDESCEYCKKVKTPKAPEAPEAK